MSCFAAVLLALGLLHGAVAVAAEPGGANAPGNSTAISAAPAVIARTPVVRRGAWHVATSANFQICSLENAAVATATAEACEELRTALAAKCGLKPTAWRPRCNLVPAARRTNQPSAPLVAPH